MKKIIGINFIVAFLSFVLFTSYSGGQSNNFTGSPGSSGTCAACHGSFPLETTGLTLTNAPTSYVKGTTYTMSLDLANSAGVVGGFQITAKKGSTSINIGTFIPNAADGSRAAGTFGLTQNAPKPFDSGVCSWEIKWTAPSTGTDNVNFYFVGNAADGGGGSGDDYVHVGQSQSIALPVQFIDFQCSTFGKNVNMTWKTAIERNVDHYEVERKNAVGTFQIIGNVKTKKDISDSEIYQFSDVTASNAGFEYYRIKCVDKDGKLTFSNIVTADRRNANNIKVYPTIVQKSGVVNIDIEENTSTEATLWNFNGQLVGKYDLQQAHNSISIDEPAGTYILNFGNWVRTIVVTQ